MKQSTAPLAASSAIMILCGFYNTIFNVLRRVFHLLGTVRNAAELQEEYIGSAGWRDIAVSVYDLVVIFNLSSGALAVLQIIAGILGAVFAALYAFREKTPKGTWLPAFFGGLCIVFGAASSFSLYMSHSAGAFLAFTLAVTQLAVPIVFMITAVRFRRGAKKLI